MAINRRKFLRASGGAAALAASGSMGAALAAPDAVKPDGKPRAVNLAALPKELPLIPVRDKVYFPGMTFPLFAGRDRTVAAIHEAPGHGGYLFVTSIADGSALAVFADANCDIGMVGYEMTMLVNRVGQLLTPAARGYGGQ